MLGAPGAAPREVRCDCDVLAPFCGACSVGDAHAPVGCDAARDWSARVAARATARAAADDPESSGHEVKSCPNPRCGCRVEKTGGCNYMVCAACSERWCWHCGAWGGGPSRRPPPHHLFFCNEPETAFARLEDDGRLAFYAERAANHAASRAFARRQLQGAHARARAIV